MSNTPTHRRFSRNALAAELITRRGDLEDQRRAYAADKTLDPNIRRLMEVVTSVRISECQRSIDYWNLGKDRRRPQGGTLTRYDG